MLWTCWLPETRWDMLPWTCWHAQNMGFVTCTRKVGHVALDVLAARNTVGHVVLDVLVAQNFGFLTCARKVEHVALDVLVARNTVGHVALNPHFCGMYDIRLPDPIVFPAESRFCDLTPRINDVGPFEFGPTTCNWLVAKGFVCFGVMPALYSFLSRGYGCDARKQFRGFFHCARLVAALYL